MNRRDSLRQGFGVALALMANGLIPKVALAQAANYNAAAFDAKTMADVLKALGGSAPTASTDITVQAPDIAENGAVVPFGAVTKLPNVSKVLLMVEKNPNTLSASFDISDAVEPSIMTRVKVGQTSNLIAAAILKDGRVLYAQKEVKVTLGGCGG